MKNSDFDRIFSSCRLDGGETECKARGGKEPAASVRPPRGRAVGWQHVVFPCLTHAQSGPAPASQIRIRNPRANGKKLHELFDLTRVFLAVGIEQEAATNLRKAAA